MSEGRKGKRVVTVAARSLPVFRGFPSLGNFVSGTWSSSGRGCREGWKRPRHLDSVQSPAQPWPRALSPSADPGSGHRPCFPFPSLLNCFYLSSFVQFSLPPSHLGGSLWDSAAQLKAQQEWVSLYRHNQPQKTEQHGAKETGIVGQEKHGAKDTDHGAGETGNMGQKPLGSSQLKDLGSGSCCGPSRAMRATQKNLLPWWYHWK